uniref:Purinergic receptor P2Y11 n=1 Tax=Neogobius melanostomus TaxID=47308 RepID=A0A8C6SCR3_9GOBI
CLKINQSSCEPFQIHLLPSLYSIEFVIALVGNSFALYLFWTKERKNWHSGIVLSCNLAISDLLYILTLPLLIVYYALQKDWIFGNAACKIERFLFNCNLYASIFFIMAISVNRCVALKYPFFSRTHLRPKHAKITSVVIWILVGVISSPVLHFASACPDMHSNRTVCVSHCNQHNTESSHFNYKMFLSVFGCVIPFLITFASYSVVIQVVWKSISITVLEKRKVALLVISVVVLYAISFLPYHVFRMIHFYQKITKQVSCPLFGTYQITKGLAALNMCIHPLLFMAVVDSIRVACCGENREDKTQEIH